MTLKLSSRFLTFGLILLALLFRANASFADTVTGVVQNAQGGPLANGTFSLALTQPAVISGTATIVPSPVNCYTDASGNVVGEPNPLAVPVVSANLASGTLASGTYFVELTYFDATGETVASPETSFALTSTGTLIVTAPTKQPASASGYKVYIGTASGAETLQGTVTGTPGSWGNFSQAAALSAGTALPVSNSSACKVHFNDELQPSFVCYDVGLVTQSGVSVPGYPQYWYLSGGSSGTVNVSQGTPQSNVCQGAGVVYPQAIVTTPAAGATQSINGGLTISGNLTDTAGENLLNFYQANNRIYVDGVKYPLTQAGISRAFTDACAIATGITKGTTVYLPPMNITVATGWVATCPLHIHGSGVGQTAITVSSGVGLTYKPNANYSQNQEFELDGVELVASADRTVLVDSSGGFPYYGPYIHDNELIAAAGSCAFDTNPVTSVNDSFVGRIIHNTMGPVCTHDNTTTGDGDAWEVANNTFNSALSGSTGAALQINCANGAAQYHIHHNHSGTWTGAGILTSTGCSQLKMDHNQFELTGGTGDANGAMIDLMGTNYTIDAPDISQNNLNGHSNATSAIRLDKVTNASLGGNVISNVTNGVLTTANTGTVVTGTNEFSTVTTNYNSAAGGNLISSLGPAGSKTAPTYGFDGTAGLGLYRCNSAMCLASNNLPQMLFAAGTLMRQSSASVVGWASTVDPNGAASDTILSRCAGGIVCVGAAESTGDSTGIIKAAAVESGGTAATLTGTGACATITTQTGGASAGQAKCTGTTGASTLTITPGKTATSGWFCGVQDQTTRANLFQQTSNTTTACTLTVTSVTQNDVFVFNATAF